MGDGVAHLHLTGGLDAADDVAHVAGLHLGPGLDGHLQAAHLVRIVDHAGVEELHLVALADGAVHDPEVGDDAPEGVEDAVEDQGLQGGLRVALGRGDALHDGLQHLVHAQAGLSAGAQDLLRPAAQQVHDLVLHLLGIRRRQVHLVEHGDDLQVVLQGQVQVADGLCLDALGGVHDQQGAFARGYAAAHLVAEVHVAGGVDQVQDVFLPVQGIVHLDRLALDGDPPLPLQVHVVQVLGLHVAVGDGAGHLQQAVGQRALAVVDVGDDAEIADVVHGTFLKRRAKVCRPIGPRPPVS